MQYFEALPSQLCTLPDEARHQLASLLLQEELDAPILISAALMEELHARDAVIDSGQEDLIPADLVIRELREKYQ